MIGPRIPFRKLLFMDEKVIAVFDESLRRCDTNPKFLDIFYENLERYLNEDFPLRNQVNKREGF